MKPLGSAREPSEDGRCNSPGISSKMTNLIPTHRPVDVEEQIAALVSVADHLESSGYSHGRWVRHARILRTVADSLSTIRGVGGERASVAESGGSPPLRAAKSDNHSSTGKGD